MCARSRTSSQGVSTTGRWGGLNSTVLVDSITNSSMGAVDANLSDLVAEGVEHRVEDVRLGDHGDRVLDHPLARRLARRETRRRVPVGHLPLVVVSGAVPARDT